MANDSEDSRHKHRSSPGGEESREHSKRHKNRHHRHHHRHHSRHSKKHDEEMKEEIEERNEVANKVEEEEVKEIAPLGLLEKTRADYDMEEGEIIEDDEFCAGNGGIGNKDAVSDVEFGEIASAGARCEEGNSDSRGISAGESRDNRNLKATENDDCKSDSFSNLIADKTDDKKTQSHIDPDELTPRENDVIVYGDRSSTASARSHRRSGSLSKTSGKRKGHFDIEGVEGSLDLMDMDEHEIGHQQNLFSCGSRMLSHRKVSRSPSHGRYHAEVHDKNRSKSVERVRERSHAQSVLHEVRSKSGHHDDDVLNDNWKTDHDADYERVTFPTADNRCNSRDLIEDKERRNFKQIRCTDREDSHYDRPSWDREREEKICRDRKMEKEEERQRRDKNYKREMEHHKEMEKERDWRRDRDREKKQEIGGERERVQERTRDVTRKREHDRDREGSMDRGRIRERDQERERRSDGCKAAYRDRSMERQWEKGRDKDGDRARDRQLDREGDGGRDRRGDRDRDIESSSRHHKYDDRDDGFGDRERHRGSKRRVYDGTKYHRGRCREDASGKDRFYEDDSARRSEDKLNRDDDDDQEDYQERVELKLAEQEEEDLNRIKEESRRRSEAILQKYKTQQLQQEVEPKLGDAGREDKEPLDPPFQPLATEDALPMNLYAEGNGQDAYVADPSFSVRKSPPENDTSAVEKTSGDGGLGEGTPTSERCSDMFCDDIFGDSPAGVRKSQGKGDGLPVESNGLYDNWDDPEGYYSYRFGEVLDGRYEIAAAHGKGVFSTVVRAKDLKAGNGDPEEVAVKIIRNNETMLKAGMEELVILKKLVGADPEDRRHCVRFLSSFKYRNHLCLVFESLHMNLREVLKKFGRNIGLKLTAVRAYAKQLFIALKHLRNCGVLHCDIKPDNMLVNDAKNVLKLCDFGNAMFAGKNELTPYLVSRFYRAPEIILGMPYDHPLDMWSVGCCLYELYTGKVLFPGPTNNDMLRLHLELKGPFPKKMLRKGAFTDQHFDQDLNFLATEDDPVTKKTIKRLLVNIKSKDIATIIKGSSGEDPKMLANFKDLLDKIFILDPDKRLTVSQALSHPFITGK